MRLDRLNAARAVALAGLAMAVSGCVDTVGQAQIEPAARIARREGVSPAGARAALAGVNGAPREAADRFAAALAPAAAARDVAIAEPGKADYLLRFYLSAAPAEAGATRVSYVFDMFDKDRRRAMRLSGEATARGAGADPWALEETTLRLLADRAADDMAAALSNTPEAIAAAGGATAIARSAPPSTPAPRVGLAAAQ